MNNQLGVSSSKAGNQGITRGKEKSFDLRGNRTHDLRIRSTVTLPTELRSRTECYAAQHSYVRLLSLRRDSPPIRPLFENYVNVRVHNLHISIIFEPFYVNCSRQIALNAVLCIV